MSEFGLCELINCKIYISVFHPRMIFSLTTPRLCWLGFHFLSLQLEVLCVTLYQSGFMTTFDRDIVMVKSRDEQ